MFPIHLDLLTLSFVLILVTAFLTFVMIFIHSTQKVFAGFGFWTIANTAITFGILLLAFDGAWADLLGTSLTFGAVLIAYEGNRRFLNLKHSLSFSSAVFIVQLAALLYFKFSGNNVVWQVSITSFLVGIISGMCGLLFAKNSSEKTNFSFKFTGITYFVFGAIMISRSIVTPFTGDNLDFYKSDGIQPIFFILYILFEIIWTFNYINLNTSRLHNELKATQTELEKQATTDFLTGTNNNRRFFEIGEDEIKRAVRFRYPLSLIMLDIDFFKRINDKYGHAAGDEVLIKIAETCREALRTTDTLGRLGGEEFAVLLPYTNIKGAKVVAEYLRSSIEEIRVEVLPDNTKITASFGVTELKGVDNNIKVMLDRADTLLYKAKNKGRNCIASDPKNKKRKELVAV